MLVSMHGIGGRGDLPVPLWLAAYSAAAAVAVSFFILAAFWWRPRFERGFERGDRGPALGLTWVVDAPAVRWLLKATGLLALGALLVTAWAGSPSPAENPAPTWLYVWIWVGIIPLSLLLGPVWRLAGIFFGPRWFAAGDAFEVYAEVLARLSPWGHDDHHRLVLRNPLRGLATVNPSAGLVGLLCVLLGSTAFDGISRWSVWASWTGGLSRAGHLAAYTAGLVAAVALVAAVFLLAARATGSAGVRPGTGADGGLPGLFAHALLPVAIGYAVAHYFSFALFQGQAGVLLATDPLGRGWDLFGLSGSRIDYELVGTSLIAAVQVGAIVLGHVLGVVSAHDRATAVVRRRALRRAQYPMLAAMVAFTAGGIALVAGS